MNFSTRNPATGETIEQFTSMEPPAVEVRLDAVHRGALQWREVPPASRADLLFAVARLLREQRERLATVAVREMGKPITQAIAEIEKCAFGCEYFAEHGPNMLANSELPSSARKSYAAFRPLGVVFAIMPWNFPYWQVFRAAAPALLAGNTILLKHADVTTRCAFEIERLFAEAGHGALFRTLLVTHEEADTLIADDRIAAITLTGSERAGIAVASAAGGALKKCVLELGGSDAFVVMADADIEQSVQTGVKSRFQNAGQSCIAAKRFIIAASIYEEWIERYVTEVRKLQVGDPALESTAMGPLVHAQARDTLHQQVTQTLNEGGVLQTGGCFIEESNARSGLDAAGNYYAPTVVANVQPGMRMFDEETFGPAAAIIRASDEQEALRLANASPYGLGGNIWTRDIERAERFAARLESGSAFINGMVASDPRLPFGGVKRSGYGRELSAFGMHEFVNVQTVSIL